MPESGADAEARLRFLKASRGAYRGQVKRLLSEPLPEKEEVISGALRTLTEKKELISERDAEILTLVPEAEMEDEVGGTFEFCRMVNTQISKYEKMLADHRVEKESSYGSVQERSGCKTKLPKLQMPTFEGDPLTWIGFWESFQSAVHQNSDISTIDKFNYLRGLLSGNAATAIEGLALSSANYEHAVELLKDRFGQKQVIVDAHIQALLEIPVASASPEKLRASFDETERHVRGLEALGIGSDTYGVVIAPILLSRFPPEIRLLVSREHKHELWDLTKLRTDLKAEIEARERSNVNGEIRSVSSNQRRSDGATMQTVGSFVAGASPKQRDCVFCGGKHLPVYCPRQPAASVHR